MEYYKEEILVYCPEIPYYHRFYDTDIPLRMIKAEAKKDIEYYLTLSKPKRKSVIFVNL